MAWSKSQRPTQDTEGTDRGGATQKGAKNISMHIDLTDAQMSRGKASPRAPGVPPLAPA